MRKANQGNNQAVEDPRVPKYFIKQITYQMNTYAWMPMKRAVSYIRMLSSPNLCSSPRNLWYCRIRAHLLWMSLKRHFRKIKCTGYVTWMVGHHSRKLSLSTKSKMMNRMSPWKVHDQLCIEGIMLINWHTRTPKKVAGFHSNHSLWTMHQVITCYWILIPSKTSI
jgi:hypothetical protein